MLFAPPSVDGRIVCYPQTPNYTGNDILLVSKEDLELVRPEISNKSPVKCFAATETNLEQYGDILRAYLRYKFDLPIASEDAIHDAESIMFFALWDRLVETFNAVTPRSILQLLVKIRAMKMPFLSNANAILNVIDIFTKRVMVPLLEGTPYVGRDENSKPRRWYPNSVNWLQSLRSISSELKSLKRSSGAKSDTLESMGEYIKNSVSKWEKLEKMLTHEKCYHIGAYSYGLAKMHRARGQLSLSLLLLHRALDLYLQYLALNLGTTLMADSGDGLRYTGTDSSFEINPLRTFKRLESSGSYTGLYGLKGTLTSLNEARNMLLMTHYVYGVEDDDIAKYVKWFEGMIQTIEGDRRLLGESGTWLSLPKIRPFLIFELEGSMDTYLSEV